METTFEKISATEGKLKVNVKEADYTPAVNKKLKEYAKTAQIKGFRPGHVPEGLIKKMYGKSILIDEVLELINKQLSEYIKENKIKTVGDPQPDKEEASQIDWDSQKEFNFSYTIGMASDFTVNLDTLPAVKSYDIEPSAARVDEAVEDMRKRFADQTHPEEVEVGDIVFGKLAQPSSEFFLETAIPTDKLSENSANKFKGLEKVSSLNFDIQTIFDDLKSLALATGKSEEEAANLAGEFSFEVTDITRAVPTEINQALFDKALGEGKASNEEEFRAEIVKIMKENYERESNHLLDFEAEKLLLDNISIELPEAFLKQWLFDINDGKFEMEVIDKDYPAFARGLKLDLIRGEIAENNDVKVDYADVEEEVKNEIRNYFGGYAYEGMDEMISNMAKKTLKENKDNAFQNYFNKAFGRKVLAFLKTKIKVEKQTVSVEDFNTIAEAAYQVA